MNEYSLGPNGGFVWYIGLKNRFIVLYGVSVKEYAMAL